MIHKRIGLYLVYKLYFRESCVVVIINYLFYVQVFACLVSFRLLKYSQCMISSLNIYVYECFSRK